MGPVVKTLTSNSLVEYPKPAYLSRNIIYSLYISVGPNSITVTKTYTKMSLTIFSNMCFLLCLTTFSKTNTRIKSDPCKNNQMSKKKKIKDNAVEMYSSYLHCFTLQNHFPASWCFIDMCLTAQ